MTDFLRHAFMQPCRVMVSDIETSIFQDPTTGDPLWDPVPPYRDLCVTRSTPTINNGPSGRSLTLPVAWSPDIVIPRGIFWAIFGMKGRDVRWYGPHKVRAAGLAFSLIETVPEYREASIVHIELELI